MLGELFFHFIISELLTHSQDITHKLVKEHVQGFTTLTYSSEAQITRCVHPVNA